MTNRPAPDLSGYTVLVIDDHDDSLYVLVTYLQQCQARVVGVSSVAEARNIMTTIKPDIILTDIDMPHETGTDLVRWLRLQAPEPLRAIPVVGVSASSAYMLPQEAALFTKFFSKPTDYDQLCETVAELIRTRKKG